MSRLLENNLEKFNEKLKNLQDYKENMGITFQLLFTYKHALRSV